MQEGQISTLSDFDKFYMVSTLLDTMNAMALSVSPSEFYIFFHIQCEDGTMVAAKTGSETMSLEIFPRR